MYEYKTKPFAHQDDEFMRTKEDRMRALFWEMGTGKTKVVIDTGAYLFQENHINGMVVLAPNGVHYNWATDELPIHMPDAVAERMHVHVYQSGRAGTKWHKEAVDRCIKHDGLAVLLMSYDAVMTDKGRRALWAMLKKRECLYTLDESAYVKTPGAKRTKRVVASGAYAPFKRILTGTPVANSPFDVYSQVRFLDPLFWRQHSIGSGQIFRHTFGEMVTFTDANGREHEFAKGYRNLDTLREWLQPIASRVLKEEVLDLPPKLYTRRYFELPPPQRRAYEDLKNEFETELDNGQITTAPLIIQRMTRFQQITSGYLPSDDGEFHRFPTNPRLGLAEEFRDECPTQAIVWAQRNEDVDQLMGLFGEKAARHDGQCSDQEKELAKKRFHEGDAQWFVAKPSSGGVGLTLIEGKNVLYYNTGYNLGERQQSEDRCHRIGQKNPVTYSDCLALNTIDEGILQALVDKFDVGAQVTGDQVRTWL
jgi:hypothetical protein